MRPGVLILVMLHRRDLRSRAVRLRTLAGLTTLFILTLSACSSENREVGPIATTGAVEGFVRDLGPNPPTAVAGASVTTFPKNAQAATDFAGFYRLQAVDPGFYDIRVNRGSGSTLIASVEVGTGETVRQDFNYNPDPDDRSRELIFLTDNDASGQIALANSRGLLQSGEIRVLGLTGVGGTMKSLRMSRVSINEAIVLSNFDHQTDPLIFDVYLIAINEFSASRSRVTNDSNPKDGVDLSPDGGRIVLSQDTDGDGFFEIWIMERDGTSPRLLVADLDVSSHQTFDNRAPNWSADGSTIAFIRRRTDTPSPVDQQDFEVIGTAADGGPLIDVTFDIEDAFAPSISTRDTTVYYEIFIGGLRQLFTSPYGPNAPRFQLTAFLTDQTDPVVSNDRKILAWVSRSNLDGSNPDGSPELTMAEVQGNQLRSVRHVTQSPSSQNLTYNSVQFRLR